MAEVNWSADHWFAKHFADKASDEFKSFWLGFYGTPSEYSENPDEQREYWVRCSFAWRGWEAAASVEREACAKACEDLDEANPSWTGEAFYYADAIRMRSNVKVTGLAPEKGD